MTLTYTIYDKALLYQALYNIKFCRVQQIQTLRDYRWFRPTERYKTYSVGYYGFSSEERLRLYIEGLPF